MRPAPSLKGFRYPRAVISFVVWAYHRFAMSLRDVEAERFLSAHDQLATISRPKRHLLYDRSYRHARADAFTLLDDYVAGLATRTTTLLGHPR